MPTAPHGSLTAQKCDTPRVWWLRASPFPSASLLLESQHRCDLKDQWVSSLFRRLPSYGKTYHSGTLKMHLNSRRSPWEMSVCLSFALLIVLLTACVLLQPPCRLSASCRQGAEPDREEVQGAEPHQYLRSPTAFTGPAFSSDDFLGEHAPGGQDFLRPFPLNLPQTNSQTVAY